MFYLLGLPGLPLAVLLPASLLSALVICASMATGGLQAIGAPRRRSAALTCIVLLALLWRARAGVHGTLAVCLDGAALVVVMFGLRGALLILALANLLYLLLNGAVGVFVQSAAQSYWSNVGLQFLLGSALPAAAARLGIAALRRWLPPHLFVFILGHGFFVAGLAAAVGLSCGALALALLQVESAHRIFGEVLPGALLLSWGEAFLSGGLTVIFVMFRPDWVLSFDDAVYLAKPKA